MDSGDLAIFKKHDDAKRIFSDVFRKAKKDIILEDEDDFLEDLAEYLIEAHRLAEEDAEQYAQTVYALWEECGCSLTAFDRQCSTYKKELF